MMNKEYKDLKKNIIYHQQKGIYIHIPFCVKKCLYCDFLSSMAEENIIRDYVASLIKEIHLTSIEAVVPTVFFGGGTPSSLDSKYIKEIMKALNEHFQLLPDAEITIECNPGTVTVEKLMDYKTSGINRISFGLQSTDNKELGKIGRIHTYEQFLESFYMAREVGFNNINIDLISALPDQTTASWESTISKIIQLNPEHISAYSLILEEGTPLYEIINKERKNGLDRIPSEDSEREMFYCTNRLLEKAGYQHYEISNYAKAGYSCRHNLIYWTQVQYLGFGIGAASYIDGVRYHNTDDINHYMNVLNNADLHNDKLDLSQIRDDVMVLTEENKMEEFMFLGLRKIEGVSENEFFSRFGVTFENIYGDISNKLVAKGLLEKANRRIFLTEKGVDLSNIVMSEFLL